MASTPMHLEQPAAAPLPLDARDMRLARGWTLAILGMHLALMLAELPNYRDCVDASYHVALARQYGERGVYFWDWIHFAPTGRPNLQGPAVHFVVGMLGRAMGGDGDDYILANSVQGLLCWVVALATVWIFARRAGSDVAALLACALVSGSAHISTTLAYGLPAFWMFLAAGWAIDAFLRGRRVVAIALASLACYAHLGGFLTVTVGIVAAAWCAKDSRPRSLLVCDLLIIGVGTFVTTSPYWVHVLRSLDWYVGVKGDTAWWTDPLVHFFLLIGLLATARTPAKYALPLGWLAASAVWIVQDTSRFLLLSSLPGAVLGSVAAAHWLDHRSTARRRRWLTAGIAYVMTVFPLGIPAWGAEVQWLIKPFPVNVDWNEMRADADVIRANHLNDRPLLAYTIYVSSAINVWVDAPAERGYWIEVQPPVDEAGSLGAAEKTYIVAAPQSDPDLQTWAARGWLTNYGGGAWTSVLRLTGRPSIDQAVAERNRVFAAEADWIAEHSEPNTMGNYFRLFFDASELPRRRAVRSEARARVTRMQVATLLEAYALEPIEAEHARQKRDDARGLGWLATLLGEENTLDFRSAEAHTALREAMRKLAAAARAGEGVDDILRAMLDEDQQETRGHVLPTKSRP